MTSSVVRSAVFLLALGVYAGPAALAQTPGAKPGDGGLFGTSGVRSTSARQSLDMTVSVSSVYDDDLAEGQAQVSSPLQTRISGQYSDLDATVLFARTRPRFAVTARAASSLRHYPDLNSFIGSSDSAAAVVTINLGRRTALRTSLDASYVSTFAFDTFSRRLGDTGDQTSLGLDASVDWATTSYRGTTELTRAVGKRSSLSLIYFAQHAERPVIEEISTEQTARAQISRSAGRDTSLQVGYSFRVGAQQLRGESRPLWSDGVQFGLERQWRHSRSRRSVLSLGVGPSMVEEPLALKEAVRSRLVQVGGSAAFVHQMSRSWNLGMSYRRGAGFIDGLIFTNAATLDIRGLVNRRIEVTGSAGYFDGEVGLTLLQSRPPVSFGSARLVVALTQVIAVYGQYFQYRYGFNALAPLSTESPQLLNRQGFRAGVTLWMPLRRG